MGDKMTKEELKNGFSKVKNDTKNWYYKNRSWIAPAVSISLTVMPFIFRFAAKQTNLAKEQKLKDKYIYDRSHGHYWELRRKLSNRELTEIDRRKDKGESLVDILESMRVLK